MKQFKLKFAAVIAAIVLASFTTTEDWVMVGCYNSPQQRDAKLTQALTAIFSGPIDILGYETMERDGNYCYEIHFVEHP